MNATSFYKDFYKESPPDESGHTRLMVKMHTDTNGDFYARIFYADELSTRVVVYQEDKTTKVFSK